MKILLDMDGVLCNWVKPVCELLDVPYQETLDNWKVGTHNLAGNLEMDRAKVWEVIDSAGEDFWANLELFPWTEDMWEHCESLADTYILTCPSLHPQSLSGKLRWMQKHRNRFFRKYLVGPPKFLCAAEDTLLIDDKDENIEKFIERGGNGILFPQPWNRNHELATEPAVRLKYVKDQLAEIVETHRTEYIH